MLVLVLIHLHVFFWEHNIKHSCFWHAPNSQGDLSVFSNTISPEDGFETCQSDFTSFSSEPYVNLNKCSYVLFVKISYSHFLFSQRAIQQQMLHFICFFVHLFVCLCLHASYFQHVVEALRGNGNFHFSPSSNNSLTVEPPFFDLIGQEMTIVYSWDGNIKVPFLYFLPKHAAEASKNSLFSV